ncbi:MAG TPA: DUF4129 domain-containing protein, partial [Gemmataceae bacterium]|nr:DUF4129 domain-containing protein [Gemmataceae bacterium]
GDAAGVPRRGTRIWHWLSLDPTPDRTADTELGDQPIEWWGRSVNWARALFDEYVVNYSPARREKAIQTVVGLVSDPVFLIAAAALVGLIVLTRVVHRHRAANTPAPSVPAPTRWFGQLLAVLAAHGFTPQPGETPREFAAGVAEALSRQPTTAALVEVPLEWTEAYYQARFGETAISPDRQTELEERLDQLARALAR